MKPIMSVIFIPDDVKFVTESSSLTQNKRSVEDKLMMSPLQRENMARSQANSISSSRTNISSDRPTASLQHESSQIPQEYKTQQIQPISQLSESGEKCYIKNMTQSPILIDFGEKDASGKPISFVIKKYRHRSELKPEWFNNYRLKELYHMNPPMLTDITEEQRYEEMRNAPPEAPEIKTTVTRCNRRDGGVEVNILDRMGVQPSIISVPSDIEHIDFTTDAKSGNGGGITDYLNDLQNARHEKVDSSQIMRVISGR